MLVHGDLGIRPHGVVATTVFGLPDNRYGSLAARATFERHLLDRLRAIPGAQSAALAVSYPLSNMTMQFQITIVGKTFAQGQEPSLLANTVSPEYFHALGIPVLRGRAFTERDSNNSQPVAIVNEDFARLYAKGGNPIGMRIRTPGWNGTRHATRTIVGVVANERARLEELPRPAYYVPIRQGPPDILSAIVRSTSVPAGVLGAAMRDAIVSSDPALAPPDTRTFAELIAQNSQEPRSIATLLASLALAALLLALCGIFGVVSYSVSQRYAEFGVRVALGARSSKVLGDVLARSLKITALGAAIGLCLAAIAAQALGSQLYHISPLDPATFTGVLALVALCSAVAAMLPAIRVVRIDPAASLRYE
jgi:putative ABC transport system permease protein